MTPPPPDPGAGLNAVLDDTDGPTKPTALGVVGWVLGRQKGRIAAGALAGIVWMGAIALIPVALGGAIDNAVDGGTWSDVALWAGLIAGAVLVEAGAGVLRHRCAVLLYVRTRWLLERLVTRRVLDPRGGPARDPGELLSRARNDAQAVGEIGDLMCRGAGAVVVFVAVGIGMLAASPLLGAIVLLGLPPCLLLLAPLWKPYERRAADQQERMAEATAVAADALAGLRVVKGLGGEPSMRRWFAEGTAAVARSAVSLARLDWAWNGIASVIPGMLLAVVLFVGGSLALDGSLSPGELVAFTGLALFLAIPLETMAEVGEVWASGLAGARRIAAVLADPPAVDEHGQARPVVGGIVLDGVAAGPLDGFDLRIADGEMLGVVCTRPEAATVLAALLARRIDPGTGTVAVAGVDAAVMVLASLRRHVLVDDGHRPWLQEATLRENLALADPRTPDARLVVALLVAAAEELAARPEGLDAQLGERGLALSGGQRQRVMLARAVAADPPVLVLDDPTSALDTVTESRLAQRLATARAGRTTVILTVSPTMLAACDRLVLVDGGRVAASGTHSELLGAAPAYRALVAPGGPS